MTRRRATVTVDEDPTGAATDAVNAGDTSSVSEWVSEAIAAKSDKRRLLAALPYAIEDFGADSARSPMKRWQGSVWEIAKLQQPSARSCTRRMMVLLKAGAFVAPERDDRVWWRRFGTAVAIAMPNARARCGLSTPRRSTSSVDCKQKFCAHVQGLLM